MNTVLSWILWAEVPALWLPLAVMAAMLLRMPRRAETRRLPVTTNRWGREGRDEPCMSPDA